MEEIITQENQQITLETRHRQYGGALDKAITGLSAIIVLYCLCYIGHVWEYMGIYIYGGVHRSLVLTFLLVMSLLLFPAKKGAPRDKLPWYDVILILLSLFTGGYLILNIERLDSIMMPADTFQQVLAVIMVVIVLECARRAVSWIFTLLGIIFITFPFYTELLPGILHSENFSFQRVMSIVYMNTNFGINGTIMHILSTTILAFITFAAFLQLSGGGKFFIDLAMGLLGRYRGGPAKVAVVASGFFGTISGSAVANVATTGVITIPLMKRVGYKPHFAAAVEAAASTGGQFTPPVMATVAFLMADFLGISYLKVCIAAALPAVLYYLALLIMVDLEAGKNDLAGLPRKELPLIRKTLAGGWIYLLPLAVLIFLLAVLRYRAETAAMYSLASIILVSFFKKESRIGPRRFVQGLNLGGQGVLEIGVAIAVAGMMVATLELTGISFRVTFALVELAGGSKIILLLLTGAIGFIMGLGIGPAPIYITLALLVGPAMVESGIDPIAAHLFLIYLSVLSMITPPECLASFVAATIAGSNFMRTGFTAMRLGAVAFLVPFIFVYSPELLLMGSAGQVALAVPTALIGIFFLSVGFEGYFLRKTGLLARVLLLAAGVVMIIPGWITDVCGFVVGVAILLGQVKPARLFHLIRANNR
jgi:TRAP transporter 4TM/12TM fusion protein